MKVKLSGLIHGNVPCVRHGLEPVFAGRQSGIEGFGCVMKAMFMGECYFTWVDEVAVVCAGVVLLEVSVVVFLLQGYLSSGREVRCPLLQPHSSVFKKKQSRNLM